MKNFILRSAGIRNLRNPSDSSRKTREAARGPVLHRDRYRDSARSRGEKSRLTPNFVCTDEDSQSIRLEIRRKRSLLLSRLKPLLSVRTRSRKNRPFPSRSVISGTVIRDRGLVAIRRHDKIPILRARQS